jgi:hypothetical protein
MTVHFVPLFFLCLSSLQALVPLSVGTSVQPELLAASDHLPLLFEFSSFRIATLQPLFFASLMFFAALLSALLGCLPTPTVVDFAMKGDGSATEFTL